MPSKVFKVKFLLTLSFLIMLEGCVAHFEKPTTGQRAKIRFIQSHFSSSAVRYIEGDTCTSSTANKQVGIIGGWGGSESQHRSGMPGRDQWDFQKLLETDIRAGQKTIMGIEHLEVTTSFKYECNLYFSFMPIDGAMYEAEFIIQNNKCMLPVYRITVDSHGNLKRVPEASARPESLSCT